MVTDGAHAVAFLTGGTGFIGGRLAAALHARGYRLRCLVRSRERARGLAALGAELIVADVTDESALQQGMRGAALAYHAAAMYDIGRVDRAAMRHANVAGTQAFLNALERADVGQAVYVSTTIVLAGMSSEAGEDVRLMEPPFLTEYQRTKAAAHGLVQQAQLAGAPLVIACPAAVYGPGDSGPSGKYMLDVLRHRIPGMSTRPTVFSYVHVDDVVAGLVAAGAQGERGATYVLSGEAMDANEFTRRIAQLANTWVSPLRFPPFMVKLTGVVMDAVGSVLHVRLPVSRELAAIGGTGLRAVHPYTRAARELGYRPRSIAEGLPETVRAAVACLGTS